MVAGRLRHGWSRCARRLAPLLRVMAGRRRARWSRVLRDGWPLDVALLVDACWPVAIRWAADARCWNATLAARWLHAMRAGRDVCGGGAGRRSGESPAMS
ncbi:hypothetical protein F511_47462 [Dorcoceras hygrometricum]|uniref:Uncharacterized protein n=1 Tax=Dorcoceras hygrometricum TaxID=472368 RepID=A0A2Z6ZXF0_9LAMI|nr:hypothetical protein F511_47462 [Dorcoceras hygrometricum]